MSVVQEKDIVSNDTRTHSFGSQQTYQNSNRVFLTTLCKNRTFVCDLVLLKDLFQSVVSTNLNIEVSYFVTEFRHLHCTTTVRVFRVKCLRGKVKIKHKNIIILC